MGIQIKMQLKAVKIVFTDSLIKEIELRKPCESSTKLRVSVRHGFTVMA
jgi:hypothetical protein